MISIDDLTYRYGTVEVLSGVSLDVYTGDYLAIVGPNGSGKSTLIKNILGILRPASGQIRLFGEDSLRFSRWGKIGYLPQRPGSFETRFPITVEEVVSLGLLAGKSYPRRIGPADLKSVHQALELAGIFGLRGSLITELSGGQQQRVFLARSLVSHPELLIFDEPTTALDPETREKFFGILDRLNKDKKITILVITHDTGNIGRYAARLLYLDKRVVFLGSFEDFCHSEEVTQYFGEFSQHLICHRHGEGRP